MRSLIQRLHGALALVVREVMKFGVIGAVAFAVDFGLFNLLLHGGTDPVLEGKPLTAKGISVACATLVAWLGNRYWTFRRRRRSAVPRELVMFAVVNVGGLVLAWLPLAVSRYVLGLSSPLADNIAANVVGLGLGTIFRFLLYRQVVFTAGTATDPGLPGGGSGPDRDGDPDPALDGHLAPGGRPDPEGRPDPDPTGRPDAAPSPAANGRPLTGPVAPARSTPAAPAPVPGRHEGAARPAAGRQRLVGAAAPGRELGQPPAPAQSA